MSAAKKIEPITEVDEPYKKILDRKRKFWEGQGESKEFINQLIGDLAEIRLDMLNNEPELFE